MARIHRLWGLTPRRVEYQPMLAVRCRSCARQGARRRKGVVDMPLIWFLVWLVSGHPALHEWNGWLVWLIISIVLV